MTDALDPNGFTDKRPAPGRYGEDARPTAVVVGGGVAGIVIARDLAAGGMRVTLLEASDRLGGKAVFHTVAGIELDAGAESFATRRGTVAKIAAEIGAPVEQPREGGAWLQPSDGAPVKLPATSMLGIPGTPLAEDVVKIIGYRGAFRAQLDTLMLGFRGSKQRNLGALVRQRMGRAVLDELVAPVVQGIHSKHPDELDVDVVAPGLRAELLSTGSLSAAVRSLRGTSPAGTAVSGIRGGIAYLVARLGLDAERRGVQVRLNSPVASVERTGVTLADGEWVDADHVVLATTLQPAAAASIALVTLVLDAPDLDDAPRGTGMLVAAGADGVAAKALTHSTAKWPWLATTLPAHRHVLRLSYNAPFPTDIEERGRRDAETLLGVRIAPDAVLGSDVVEWTPVPARPAAIDGVTIIGEAVAGTGLAAVIASARREAERMLGALEP